MALMMNAIKYIGYVQSILSRQPWTTLTVSARTDFSRVGIDEETAGDNFLLLASQRFGIFRRGYYLNEEPETSKEKCSKGLLNV